MMDTIAPVDIFFIYMVKKKKKKWCLSDSTIQALLEEPFTHKIAFTDDYMQLVIQCITYTGSSQHTTNNINLLIRDESILTGPTHFVTDENSTYSPSLAFIPTAVVPSPDSSSANFNPAMLSNSLVRCLVNKIRVEFV